MRSMILLIITAMALSGVIAQKLACGPGELASGARIQWDNDGYGMKEISLYCGSYASFNGAASFPSGAIYQQGQYGICKDGRPITGATIYYFQKSPVRGNLLGQISFLCAGGDHFRLGYNYTSDAGLTISQFYCPTGFGARNLTYTQDLATLAVTSVQFACSCPCVNGTCVSGNPAICRCNTGYVGDKCDVHNLFVTNAYVGLHGRPALDVFFNNSLMLPFSSSDLTCNYTFSATDASDRSTVEWYSSRYRAWTLVSGNQPPSSWVYQIGDGLSCRVNGADSLGFTAPQIYANPYFPETDTLLVSGILSKFSGDFPTPFDGVNDMTSTQQWWIWTKSELTWLGGYAACYTYGKVMPSPFPSATVASSVTAKMRAMSIPDVWISLHRMVDGTWLWDDGTVYTYSASDWAILPPNDGSYISTKMLNSGKFVPGNGSSAIGSSSVLCSVQNTNYPRTMKGYAFRGEIGNATLANQFCQARYGGGLMELHGSAETDLASPTYSRLSSWFGLVYPFNSYPDGTYLPVPSMFNPPPVGNRYLCSSVQNGTWWQRDCINSITSYCDFPLLTVTTTTKDITFTPSTGSFLNQGIISIAALNGPVISTYDMSPRTLSLPTPPVPGKWYQVSVNVSGQSTPWMKFRMGCDCNADYVSDGMPRNLVIKQNNLDVTVSWTDYSPCEAGYEITLNGSRINNYYFLSQDDRTCSKLGLSTTFSSVIRPFDDAPGAIQPWCVWPTNTDASYPIWTGPKVCINRAIEWQSRMNGQITTPNGYPVLATLYWYVDGVTPALGGVINTTASGQFDISVISSLLPRGTQTVVLRAEKLTGSIAHNFTFSCSGCTNRTQNIVAINMDMWPALPKTVSIVDQSVYTLSGKVTFQMSGCPAQGVQVCATVTSTTPSTLVCTTTINTGLYVINLPLLSTATVNATYASMNGNVTVKQHTLMGPFGTTYNMNQNYINVNFVITSTNQLGVVVGGGQCMRDIGSASFILEPVSELQGQCSWSMPITISNVLTYYQLPPFDMQITIDEGRGASFTPKNIAVDGASIVAYLKQQYNYFRASLSSNTNITYAYQYFSQPVISIVSIGGPPCGDNFVVQGSPAVIPVNVTIRAWEAYGTAGNCYVNSNITFWDGLVNPNISDTCNGCYSDCLLGNKGCSLTLTKSSVTNQYSEVITTTIPGDPNVDVTPFMRQFVVSIPAGYWAEQRDTANVIVTGVKRQDAPVSYEIPISTPLTMVFDPPGGNSYSYIQAGTTLSSTTDISFDIQTEDHFESLTTLGVALEMENCVGIGVVVCQTILESQISAGIIGNSASVTGNTVSTTIEQNVQISTTISTSSNPGLIPPMSDVVVVSSVSLLATKVFVLSVNTSTCEPVITESNAWLSQLNGYSIHTIYDIINLDIPGIQEALQVENDPANAPSPADRPEWLNRIQLLNNSLSMWNAILTLHDNSLTDPTLRVNLNPTDTLKCANSSSQCQEAQQINNLRTVSFTGGGSQISISTSFENSQLQASEGNSAETSEIGGAINVDVNALGVLVNFESKAWGTKTKSITQGSSRDQRTFTEVGFVLSDDQLGDKFTVSMYRHRDFGTPVFVTSNAVSMCPWEPNSIQREKPQILIQPAVLNNVQPDKPAVFNVTLINLSETDETVTYDLSLDQTTNPYGLSLKLAGVPWTGSSVTVPSSRLHPPVVLLMEVIRSSVAYEFSGISITMGSQCENQMAASNQLSRDPISSTSTFGVNFLRPCAQVVWAGKMALDLDDDYFDVNANSTETQNLTLTVRNPQWPSTLWASNPRLQSVQVLFKAPGRDWAPCYTPGGNVSYFVEDSVGYASTVIDTSRWTLEGVYKLQVKSTCQASAVITDESLLSGYTSIITGRVDRTPPQMFGQFAQPADGSYFPGDTIAMVFQESLDCNILSYPFSAALRVVKNNVSSIYNWGDVAGPFLDVMCQENTLSFAFGRRLLYTDIMGGSATLSITRVQDLAGNVNTNTLSWTFALKPIELATMVVSVSQFMMGGRTLEQYLNNQRKRDQTQAFQEKFCSDLSKMLSFKAERCHVDSVSEEPAGINVGFSLSPPSSPGETDSIALYSKFLDIMSNPSKIPPGYDGFSSTTLNNTSYEMRSTVPESQLPSSMPADGSAAEIQNNTSEQKLTSLNIGLISALVIVSVIMLISIAIVALILFRRNQRKREVHLPDQVEMH
eukprot:TRINITY_DN3264_c0_g1_i2.p1 TRINITY_DN3264_c0_g1~~TRINITY_DN3264_c0_g1_i2.p1  ORF type:complete len:2181 (-),score=503.01 TRINITY_DN3264_c0_g1_i2:42-6584(-)